MADFRNIATGHLSSPPKAPAPLKLEACDRTVLACQCACPQSLRFVGIRRFVWKYAKSFLTRLNHNFSPLNGLFRGYGPFLKRPVLVQWFHRASPGIPQDSGGWLTIDIIRYHGHGYQSRNTDHSWRCDQWWPVQVWSNFSTPTITSPMAPWHCDHATTAHDHLGSDSQRNLTECCWPFENLGSRHSDISLTSSFGIPVGQNGCKKHVATTLPVVHAVWKDLSSPAHCLSN